jgi:hypothetical protein
VRRFIGFRKHVASGSIEGLASELGQVTADLQLGLMGNLQLPAMNSRGDELQGSNLKVVLRRIRFKNADEDVRISHGLGRVPRHWMPCNPDTYARFKKGTQGPSEKFLYIQCDMADTEADFLIWSEAGGATR